MNDAAKTVFVVEDDQAVSMSLAVMLRTAGFDVQSFDSAEQFLKFHARSEIKCLLVDIRLPGMNGNELIEWLRNHRRHDFSCIIMSGHGDDEIFSKLSQLSSMHFCTKPHDPKLLVALVHEIFDEHHSESVS